MIKIPAKYMSFIFFLTMMFCLQCHAKNNTNHMHENNLNLHANNEKFCVTKDQIIVSESGLFVDLGDSIAVPITSILWLDDNVFEVDMLEAFFWDPPPPCRHGIYCPNCNGCKPTNMCANRCKCPGRRKLQ